MHAGISALHIPSGKAFEYKIGHCKARDYNATTSTTCKWNSRRLSIKMSWSTVDRVYSQRLQSRVL